MGWEAETGSEIDQHLKSINYVAVIYILKKYPLVIVSADISLRSWNLLLT
jgi:hypothetical protein